MSRKDLILGVFILLLSHLSYAQEGKFAEVNGAKIYYEIHGEGAPLVLLHGFTLSHDMWLPWVEELSKDHQVILVDLRGHGRSTNPTNEFRHSQAAADVYGLMDHLGIREFSGMGFSTGAMTLTHMATKDTTRLQSMILIGGGAYYSDLTRQRLSTLTFDYIKENIPDWLEFMKTVHPGGEEQIKTLLTQFNNFADTYSDMNFTGPYLSTIKCPTLIIHGDRDRYFEVDMSLDSYLAIPNAYLWVIPNYGHSTPNNGTPLGTIFSHNVSQFLAGEWSN